MNSKIIWKKGISRRETPIRSELLARGASKYVTEILGVPNDNFLFYLENGNGAAYFDPIQISAMGEKIASKVRENPLFLKQHIDQLLNASNYLLSISKKIGESNLSLLTLNQIESKLDLFVEAHLKFGPFMMIPIAIEKVITSLVRERLLKNEIISGDENKLEFYLSKLMVPKEQSQVIFEMRDFNKIINLVKTGEVKEYQSLLEKHWGKYKWLAVYSPSDEPYTLEYFEKRLQDELVLNPKEPKTVIEVDDRPEDITKKLGLGEDINSFVELLREYVYLRTYRVEQLCKAYFYVQPLFKEIAKRAKVSLYELCLCSLEEIRKFLDGGSLPSSNEIKRRKSKYLYIVKNGNFELFSGKNAEDVFLKEVGEEDVILEVKVIKGSSASKGIGKGKVHVILSKNEIPDFKNGEVLVTIMTNPDFVVIMKKAVAIVTDEGGVLCHAAIVSRELGIPCVVGTKVATKVLKNGDMVEVDAFKGLVKKV